MYLLETYLLNRPKAKDNTAKKYDCSGLNSCRSSRATGILDSRRSQRTNLADKAHLNAKALSELEDKKSRHPISCLVQQIERHHRATNKKIRYKY